MSLTTHLLRLRSRIFFYGSLASVMSYSNIEETSLVRGGNTHEQERKINKVR